MRAARTVKLNTDTDFIKIIAIVTMTIDHAGKMFFPQLTFLRLIGRIAFPLFCYCMAVGCVYTKNLPRYIARVGVMAIVTQPIYVLALAHVNGNMQGLPFAAEPVLSALRWYFYSLRSCNILFTLLVGLVLIGSIREEKYVLTALAAACALYFSGYLSYGWQGVALILAFYLFLDRPLASLVWVAGYMLWWAETGGTSYRVGIWNFSSQVFALMALPIVYLPTDTKIKLPKSLFYFFYPAHLAIIYIITILR